MDEDEQDKLADDTAEVEEVIFLFNLRFCNTSKLLSIMPRVNLNLKSLEKCSHPITNSANNNE